MYKEYADVKYHIGLLENRADELKLEILESQKEDKVENEFGVFNKRNKKSWTYSKKLQKQEDKLKVDKVDEQESGKAKVEISISLVFSPISYE